MPSEDIFCIHWSITESRNADGNAPKYLRCADQAARATAVSCGEVGRGVLATSERRPLGPTARQSLWARWHVTTGPPCLEWHLLLETRTPPSLDTHTNVRHEACCHKDIAHYRLELPLKAL